MKFLKKLKSSNFWVSMISAVVLILQAVFNVDIKTEYLSQIIMAMLGVLVMTGIVSDSPNNENENTKSSSVDNLTQNLAQVFTQTIANMETNILSIITQFEKITDSFASQEVVSNEPVQQIKNEDEKIVENVKILNEETQPQDIIQSNNDCTKIGTVEQSDNSVLAEQVEVVQEVKTSNLNVL